MKKIEEINKVKAVVEYILQQMFISPFPCRRMMCEGWPDNESKFDFGFKLKEIRYPHALVMN